MSAVPADGAAAGALDPDADVLLEHTVWQEEDVDPSAVEAAMRALELERVRRSPTAVPARALNLVVIADAEYAGEVTRRLEAIGRNQPSRTVLLRISPARTTLRARLALAAPPPGRPAAAAERLLELCTLDVGPRHLSRLAAIIDPVVLTDVPTLLWDPHGHRDALKSLLPLAQTVLLDSAGAPDERAGLEDAHALAEHRDLALVDLAWLRTTPWRQRLAATFQPASRREGLARIDQVVVRHEPGSTASAWLVVGWLGARLGWSAADGGARDAGGAPIGLVLQTTETAVPGLAGMTLRMRDGGRFALDRNPGGLRAQRTRTDGHERTWSVHGASRGEAGVLASALRRTLVPDDGYREALLTARRLFPWT